MIKGFVIKKHEQRWEVYDEHDQSVPIAEFHGWNAPDNARLFIAALGSSPEVGEIETKDYEPVLEEIAKDLKAIRLEMARNNMLRRNRGC